MICIITEVSVPYLGIPWIWNVTPTLYRLFCINCLDRSSDHFSHMHVYRFKRIWIRFRGNVYFVGCCSSYLHTISLFIKIFLGEYLSSFSYGFLGKTLVINKIFWKCITSLLEEITERGRSCLQRLYFRRVVQSALPPSNQ